MPMLPVAILAGGRATRLRPITETIPKALVDVAGTPFILRQLEYLRRQGIELVVLCVGHLGEQIKEVVGDGARYGIGVRYSWDGPKLRGTGGAIKQALPELGEHFFVFYGDSYLPIDFSIVQQAFLSANQPALMTVMRNDNRWDKSNVEFVNGRIVEYNKHMQRPTMTYIDYGLGVLAARALADVPEDKALDLADIYHALSMRGQLAGYEVFQRFYEIGSHAGLAETIHFFNEADKA